MPSRQNLRFVLTAVVVAGLCPTEVVVGQAKPTPTTKPSKPFFATPWLLGAHRGGAALWPENTLVAFRAAAKRWPNIVLETDARLTADGQVVLLHDDTVDRTTDGHGPVSEMTLAEVKRLDAGHRFTRDGGKTFPWRGKDVRIPTLTEALEACPDSRFEVELKAGAKLPEALAKAIQRAEAEDRVLLASFHSGLILRARRLLLRCPVCYEFAGGLDMLGRLRKGGEVWTEYKPTADVLSLMQRMVRAFQLKPEEVRRMQAKGIYVQLHTPNTRQRIRGMLRLGPDSILTDRPDLLAEAMDEPPAASR